MTRQNNPCRVQGNRIKMDSPQEGVKTYYRQMFEGKQSEIMRVVGSATTGIVSGVKNGARISVSGDTV